MLDRRAFLFATATAGATLATARLWGEQCPVAPELPRPELYQSNEEAYWRELRKQFLIPADEIYLNNGTVGSSPMPVIQAVMDGYRATETMAQDDPEDYPRDECVESILTSLLQGCSTPPAPGWSRTPRWRSGCR